MIANLSKQETGKLISPLKILFAHHDDQVLTMLGELFELQSIKGQIELEFTNDGPQFLKQLSKTEFDIVIIDEHLTHINFPKVFHDLAQIYPRSKVLFLMDEFDDQTILANELCNIQFFKKPFTQKELTRKIELIISATKYEMRNIDPASLILTLSTIKNKAALCLLNDETGDSAEVFIEDKTIKYVTVEKGDQLLEGFKALNDLMDWTHFESRYSDATFPGYKNLRADSMEVLYKYLQSGQKEKAKSQVQENPSQPYIYSAEKQQRLRELLGHVPQFFTDGFIMNAFLNKRFKFLAQLKNPRFNEILYRISDSISENFKIGAEVLNDKTGNSYQADLPNSVFMRLYKINDEIYYFSILTNNEDNPEELERLISSFPDSISSILNKSINMYEFLN